MGKYLKKYVSNDQSENDLELYTLEVDFKAKDFESEIGRLYRIIKESSCLSDSRKEWMFGGIFYFTTPKLPFTVKDKQKIYYLWNGEKFTQIFNSELIYFEFRKNEKFPIAAYTAPPKFREEHFIEAKESLADELREVSKLRDVEMINLENYKSHREFNELVPEVEEKIEILNSEIMAIKTEIEPVSVPHSSSDETMKEILKVLKSISGKICG